MRAFVLTTGRSGSTTFSKACSHISNYTSAHESRISNWVARFNYEDDHIEVDPRLAWWLGTLDRLFGDEPVYVWLRREFDDVARSTAKRTGKRNAFTHWPYVAYWNPDIPLDFAASAMVGQIDDNIELFLKDKTKVVEVWIENPDDSFLLFWEMIGAEGDFSGAMKEFEIKHNRS